MATKTLDELDPDSPEFAALEAQMLAEEDIAHGRVLDASPQETTEDKPAATTTEAATTAEATPATITEPTTTTEAAPADPAPTAKVAGVLGKDGKTVLPYAALKGARQEAQAERHARQAAEAENERLKQELADARAGKKTADQQTDEELDALLEEHPQLKPVVTQLKEVRKATASAAAPATTTQDEPAEGDETQDAIDALPMLADWQAADRAGKKGDPAKQKLWTAAARHDAALELSPEWEGKPLAERFAEAVKRTARDHRIQVEDEPSSQPKKEAAPAAPRKDPKEVIAAAERTAPTTLTDFKGGAAHEQRESVKALPVVRQVNKFAEMSDDEIDAHLRISTG